MDIAMLFGAGASFGAGGVSPGRPPLGRNLLECLQARYPDSWGALLTDPQRAAFEKDFEDGFVLLWADQGRSRAQRLIIDMALYFASFTLVGDNCYSRLLHIVRTRNRSIRMACCTLNYDCLLEEALAAADISVVSLGRQIGSHARRCHVLKPHGSCNYISPMTRMMKNSTMGHLGSYVHHETATFDELEIVAREEVQNLYDAAGGLTIPPAISLYEPKKHSPVGAGAIGLVRDQWADAAREADVVLCIGARPVEHDRHIWEPVLNARGDIWFVGGKDDAFHRLARVASTRLKYLGREFGQSLASIQRLLTLR